MWSLSFWEYRWVVNRVTEEVHTYVLDLSSMPVWKPEWHVSCTHLSCLGVVDVTVRDGLWQLHNPVVDLVPAPPLNCWNNIWIWDFPISISSGIAQVFVFIVPSLCWARRFSSLEPRGASCFLENRWEQKTSRWLDFLRFSTFGWNWSLLIRCNSAVILSDYDVITLCTAECEVRLSFDWNPSKLPGVTSSHKAAL